MAIERLARTAAWKAVESLEARLNDASSSLSSGDLRCQKLTRFVMFAKADGFFELGSDALIRTVGVGVVGGGGTALPPSRAAALASTASSRADFRRVLARLGAAGAGTSATMQMSRPSHAEAGAGLRRSA